MPTVLVHRWRLRTLPRRLRTHDQRLSLDIFLSAKLTQATYNPCSTQRHHFGYSARNSWETFERVSSWPYIAWLEAYNMARILTTS
ncbi:hypothetical protein AC579_519 [Pseudocercospora musae]|uniref:Uncharacterized protein n=1 Tax=Pseudocercospora musae TaxID=113226 RepID=A0A139IRH3_9PEZI|nr:hypothetical protein AC579_519 [Pseudocercospora musae]